MGLSASGGLRNLLVSRHLAIWPIGHFEARQAPWALSAAARRDLPWLVGE
jgi:hypothetical protein